MHVGARKERGVVGVWGGTGDGLSVVGSDRHTRLKVFDTILKARGARARHRSARTEIGPGQGAVGQGKVQRREEARPCRWGGSEEK